MPRRLSAAGSVGRWCFFSGNSAIFRQYVSARAAAGRGGGARAAGVSYRGVPPQAARFSTIFSDTIPGGSYAKF
jgi:hypothetical protein